MTITDALKEFLALEKAKWQAFSFAVRSNSHMEIKTGEEIQAELKRKLQEHPKTDAEQAYIATLEKMLYWYFMNSPRQIAVDYHIQAGRLDALEFAVAEHGNLPKIGYAITQSQQRLDKIVEKRGEYSSPSLSYTGYLEGLIEAKELIQQLNNE